MWKVYFCSIVSLLLFSQVTSSEWEKVGQLSYNLMKEDNLEVHGTKLFHNQPGLFVRHNLDFHLALQLYEYCGKPFSFQLIENKSVTIFTWNQQPLIQQREVRIHFHVNQTIPVGLYTFNIINPCLKEANTIRLCDVNVMFNPWQGRLEHKRVRRQNTIVFTNEYLYNNYGYIWLNNLAIPWNYAVGSGVVIRSRDLLTQLMTQEERSNEIQYSRALTRLIGRNVLHGNWDGDYSDGVDPTVWVGSEEILSRWLQFGERVRYAQCWVFAAILTTMLRASGIPARTVTNYGSHHDRGLTNNGRAVLRQYDNIVQSDESIWNFHVWSEAWLERPDLGQPSGWNAVDATPQEPSPLAPGQPYRSGPAYVPFIRSDMRNARYDTYFILAEVNAINICPITGNLIPNDVGYAVVTKKQGMARSVYNFNNPEYITANYKISSVSKRDSESPDLPPPYTGCEREGGLRLNSTPLHPLVGENFVITVSNGNTSAEDFVIRMELRNYMGESLGFIRNFTGIRQLTVRESDYLPYLDNSSVFRFSVGVYDQSGRFEFHDDLRIRLEYNQIEVNATRDINSTTITLTLEYRNPLSISMTGVMLSIAGPNDTYSMTEQPDIPPNGQLMTTMNVQCGDNNDMDVMIPISLDSDVTQSVYGTGWSSCMDSSRNSGTFVLSEISVLLTSFVLCILYT